MMIVNKLLNLKLFKGCVLVWYFKHVPDVLTQVFHVSISNDGAEFGGSVYQKVNDRLETAITLAWTAGSNNTRFGVAAKYQLDEDASVSVSSGF